MTKYKRPLLLICLIVLLVSALSAQTSPPSVNDLERDYGIDPGASYPGQMVQALLEAAEDEAGDAIKEAYAAGYKTGLLDAAPDAAYWRKFAEELEAEALPRSARSFLWGALSGAIGVVGVGFGVYMSMR